MANEVLRKASAAPALGRLRPGGTILGVDVPTASSVSPIRCAKDNEGDPAQHRSRIAPVTRGGPLGRDWPALFVPPWAPLRRDTSLMVSIPSMHER